MTTVNTALKLLTSHRWSLSDEKVLQSEIAVVLTDAGLEFRREVHLGPRDIVDFMVYEKPCRPDAGLKTKEGTQAQDPIGKADAAGSNITRQQIPLAGIAIEIKIKGSRRAIYRQLERYCGYEAVGAIVLATNVPMNLPELICGKPALVAALGRGWL